MAKPMKLMVEVEEIAHGRIFRLLDGAEGVVSITPIGDGPKSARQNSGTRGQKQGGAQSAPCLVLGALLETPGLGRRALEGVLEANGKKATSLPDTLAKLRKARELASKGAGKNVVYNITAAGKKRYETACKIQPPTGE